MLVALLAAAAAATEPAPPPVAGATDSAAPADAGTQTLEARLAALESELQRLRLQLPEEEAEPAATATAPPAAAGPNVFNPTLTAVGNGLFRWDDRPVEIEGARVDKTFSVREVELDLRAAVDPFADGVVIVAFPAEVPGEYALEMEEAFVTIKRLPLPVLDDPPLGLKLKAGRFRTEFGRLNRLHLHDLPQVDRPLTAQEFLGEDGYIANGLSAQVFLPTPFDEASALELTAQALTGGGVPLAEGTASPAIVANLRWFRTLGRAHNLDLSAIFHYGRTDSAGKLAATTWSGDFLYKWKPHRGGEFRSLVLGGQVFYARRDFLDAQDTDADGAPDAFPQRFAAPLGWFAFAQYQLTRSAYLGARWDDTATLADDSVRRRAASGWLAWYASEFLRLRLGYEHRFDGPADPGGRNSAYAELNFIFGAHPTEPFWVNK